MPWWIAIKGVWGGLPTPVQKGIEYAALAGLVILLLKVFWLNKHDNAVANQTKSEVTEQVRKQEEARWKPIADKLVADNLVLQTQLTTAHTANAELERSRTGILSALNTSITQSRTVYEVNREKVSAVPAADLVNAIIVQSNKLANSAPVH